MPTLKVRGKFYKCHYNVTLGGFLYEDNIRVKAFETWKYNRNSLCISDTIVHIRRYSERRFCTPLCKNSIKVDLRRRFDRLQIFLCFVSDWSE